MRHIILSTLFIFACLHAYGQEYVEYDYLKEAAACLAKGDYECAKRYYTLHQGWENVDMSAQIKMVDECFRAVIAADDYFANKKYEEARDRYKRALDKNPKDPYAKKQYDACLRLLGNNNGTTVAVSDEKGVVINGVRWATRNVDRPGTFAATPESAGMLYQWNRKKAWPTTGKEVTGWDSSVPPAIDTWEKANDPSPAGWRVPTLYEIKTLFDTDNVSIDQQATQNGVTGIKFTDKTTGNTLFLPSTRERHFSEGTLYGDRDYKGGTYWSSTIDKRYLDGRHDHCSICAYNLQFVCTANGIVGWDFHGYRNNGFNIRPVAE